ncbi:MAG: VCBS repeat-containing protein [Alphaproteobacteria bacterium]|nr:VCBS repeat-containing protein [Alphaproteobacteria bacterium]
MSDKNLADREEMITVSLVGAALAGMLTILVSCGDTDGGDPTPDPPAADDAPAVVTPPPAATGAPKPVQQPLEGDPRASLLLAHAWFYKDAEGRPKPGPARLDIWRETDGAWGYTRLEDADSNVFHKAMPYDGGILTIGAEGANLKKWTFADGKWTGELLWTQSWGGKYNRLRDVEIGDVDHDGKDEFVIATHDAGVVAVINPPEGDGEAEAIEMDQKADTFVHEIEIGDVDGDGKVEFFATPTDRNTAKGSQGGMMVMYRWNGPATSAAWSTRWAIPTPRRSWPPTSTATASPSCSRCSRPRPTRPRSSSLSRSGSTSSRRTAPSSRR